ncbi:MAG: exodeoxyribonuclease VII small subunit [Gammaproteobacteria bacterium]|nr:exodeoxyribonuclease VII small subunit [Gammaproteobacteria bacterium]
MTKSPKSAIPDFEAALKELETIVANLEKGDVGLDAALKYFERGISLTRQCQAALKQAELKVEMLMEKDGHQTLADLDREED